MIRDSGTEPLVPFWPRKEKDWSILALNDKGLAIISPLEGEGGIGGLHAGVSK